MKRNVSLEEISDGNLYDLNDMVKAGCSGCEGCSDCCRGMGQSIILDPLDVHRLVSGLGLSIEQLLQDKLELNVVDGIILPNIRQKEAGEACGFLNEQGRCSIHSIRPGICRLFPLGRYYGESDVSDAGASVTSEENGSKRGFKYFLQVHECSNQNCVKVKVKKWIDTPQIKENEKFVTDWHYFLKDVEQLLEQADENVAKQVNLYLLQQFYMMPFGTEDDFYEQFHQRLSEAKKKLGIIK